MWLSLTPRFSVRSPTSRWPNNAAGRRQEARRAARAPGQGVSEEAARKNVREEAAVEVAAGAEEAQKHVDELDHDEADVDEVAEQVIEDTQDDDRDHMYGPWG